jgi:hypothetical protein
MVLGALALGIAACTTSVSPAPSPTSPPVRVYNQTSVAMTLVVNGSAIAVIPAESLADPVASPLPARPWAIRLQSPSGRPLVTLDVPAGDITVGLYGQPNNLACGFIFLAVAGPLPVSEPAFTALPGQLPCT